MGYFSNGSEGDWYTEEYCEKCAHNDPEGPFCEVWMLHQEWNYSQHDNATQKHALTVLIPRDAKGNNLQCKMFIAKEPTP